MMLLDELKISIAEALTRSASSKCSTWAQNYIRLGMPVPGPLRFDMHPWSKEMHDCDSSWVGMKAAQMAFTQTAIDRCLYTIDKKRISVSYFLPKRNPDATDFSKTKFDTILEYSPYVADMFSSVRNVGHKQAGTVDFFIRGAKSRSGFKAISTGTQVFDELDEMNIKLVILGEERKSGFVTEQKQVMRISTPTIPNYGIDKEFLKSKQMHYCFICPGCSKWTELTFPECLVITAENSTDDKGIKNSYLRCKECGVKLPHEDKARFLSHKTAKWIPYANLETEIPGFQINQLYSIVMKPWEFAFSALRAYEDSDYRQEFENSKRGLPFVEEGSSVTAEHIRARMADFRTTDPVPTGLITMGVDVGPSDLYCQISQWFVREYGKNINQRAIKKVLATKICHDFGELDALMQDYGILHCVVDVNPEFRAALAFAFRFKGHVTLCRFVQGISLNDIQPEANATMTIQVNRTAWLDISQGRFMRNSGIFLPQDLSEVYKAHIQVLVKVRREDENGNLVSRYIKRSKADHFAFANVYDEMALPLAVAGQENQDIKNFL